MKKLYTKPGSGLLIPAFLILPCLGALAQTKVPAQSNTAPVVQSNPVITETYARQTTFIDHAPVVLPALLQAQKWKEMKNFLINWRNAIYANSEWIAGMETLLAIETGTFDSYQLPCDLLIYLCDYSKELENMKTPDHAFKYYLHLSSRYSYDATEDARKMILFMQSWALRLINTRSLDHTELYLCRVLAGQVQDPVAEFQSNKKAYPRIAQMEDNIRAFNEAAFIARRDGRRGTAAILAGWWAPTGHLQTLGSHPSVSVQFGVRTKLNEYDITWSFRFLHPTPQTYTFLRQDTLYSSNYYDGGSIGFDYTRYFLHKRKVDLGFTSGIGYDYFSVADGFHSEATPWLEPLNVGSFDFNNGIRFKYFLGRRGFVGLVAKYHLIHYANQGGTDLNGNAFSIDLLYGSH